MRECTTKGIYATVAPLVHRKGSNKIKNDVDDF